MIAKPRSSNHDEFKIDGSEIVKRGLQTQGIQRYILDSEEVTIVCDQTRGAISRRLHEALEKLDNSPSRVIWRAKKSNNTEGLEEGLFPRLEFWTYNNRSRLRHEGTCWAYLSPEEEESNHEVVGRWKNDKGQTYNLSRWHYLPLEAAL